MVAAGGAIAAGDGVALYGGLRQDRRRPAGTNSPTSSIFVASRTCPAMISLSPIRVRSAGDGRREPVSMSARTRRRSSPTRAAGSARPIGIRRRSSMSAAIASASCAACGATLIGDEPEAAPPYSPDWAEALGCETLLDAARPTFRVHVGRSRFAPATCCCFAFAIMCRPSISASRPGRRIWCTRMAAPASPRSPSGPGGKWLVGGFRLSRRDRLTPASTSSRHAWPHSFCRRRLRRRRRDRRTDRLDPRPASPARSAALIDAGAATARLDRASTSDRA